MIPATTTGTRIAPMAPDAIEKVRRLEAMVLQLPQVEIPTHHVIHGGMYARTICIPAGAMITGAEIKRATVLVLSGDATVYIGSDSVRLAGYHVLPASAGRKQAFVAHVDTQLTMLFPTQAQRVAEAEDEFTDEAHLLSSRQNHGIDTVIITGE